MGRDDGFPIADVATGLLDDDKVRKLWRRLGDRAAMCEAVTMYMAVVLASWGGGKRLTVDESVPVWLDPDPDRVADLQAVQLLDGKQMIPFHVWDAWFAPAKTRRAVRREAGRLGGLASGKGRTSTTDAQANVQQPSSNGTANVNPSVPSVPTVPSVGSIASHGRPAPARPNTVDKVPLYREIRAAIAETYGEDKE